MNIGNNKRKKEMSERRCRSDSHTKDTLLSERASCRCGARQAGGSCAMTIDVPARFLEGGVRVWAPPV